MGIPQQFEYCFSIGLFAVMGVNLHNSILAFVCMPTKPDEIDDVAHVIPALNLLEFCNAVGFVAPSGYLAFHQRRVHNRAL